MTKISWKSINKTFQGEVELPPTDYDGNVYTEVVIGTQTWLVENLRTKTFLDGTDIPFKSDGTAWALLENTDTSYGCAYPQFSSSYFDDFGMMYSYAVTKQELISGYRVPTRTELDTLVAYTGVNDSLKSDSTTHWIDVGPDSYGFTSVGSSYLLFTGAVGQLRGDGYLWASTEFNSTDGQFIGWTQGGANVAITNNDKSMGIGIRLIKD